MTTAPPATRQTLLATWGTLGDFKATPFPPDYPANLRHLFAPVDDVHGALVALCSPTDLASLECAMYGWDDEEIDALFRRALLEEDLPVTLCLDSSQAAGVHEREILAAWPGAEKGNDLLIGRSAKHAISHDKVVVVNRIVTIVGSTNFSAGGETKQNNEATVVYDRAFAAEMSNRIARIAAEMRAQMEAR